MSLDMLHIMDFSLLLLLFAFYHFEDIYLISGKIGNIKIWP